MNARPNEAPAFPESLPVALPLPELTPMFEAHVPHEAIQSWKGFFTYIAAIVIGLFIAVGLEQSVEYFHHRHQRALLEEQIHAVFEDEPRLIDSDTKRLSDFRSYLANIQYSIADHRRGQQGLPAIHVHLPMLM